MSLATGGREPVTLGSLVRLLPETTMKTQKEHDMVPKLQITSNNNKSNFYSKTQIFGKVLGSGY